MAKSSVAVSASACQNKKTQKPATFSKSEIDAAKQLIQLSSGDSDTYTSSNNSNSYSVQGKPQQHQQHSKVVDAVGGDDVDVSSTASIEDVYKAEALDESFPATNKIRYRYIEDLYSVTQPVKSKKTKCRK